MMIATTDCAELSALRYLQRDGCSTITQAFRCYYRSPLRSLTTASIHWNMTLSSISSHPSSMRATSGASKTMASSGAIPAGKVIVDAIGETIGVPPPDAGVPGLVRPSLCLLLGMTIGRE